MPPPSISPCRPEDLPVIAEIINESAEAYRGVIPPDRWHEPYMPLAALQSEIAAGVRFHGCRAEPPPHPLVAVMGIQDVCDVTLIRHAYVRTAWRAHGLGGRLLAHLRQLTPRPILIGTWRAATWAIRFYEKHGFALVSEPEKNRLLQTYWTIPARQVEESVVLADARFRSLVCEAQDLENEERE